MQTRALKFTAVVFVFLFTGLLWQLQMGREGPSEDEPVASGLGSVQTLLAAYDRWKAIATRSGANQNLVLPLRYSKGMSTTFTKAHGRVTLDLVDGSVAVEVSGLDETQAFDVWLVDNRLGPEQSVKPEPGDRMMHLGSVRHKQGMATLHTNLGREVLTDFRLDLAVVTQGGVAPTEAGLLFASPGLLQRLYYSEQRGQFARLDDEEPPRPDVDSPSLLAAPFRVLIPNPVHAQEDTAGGALRRLIDEGERLFFEETFGGNSRTCGTCHPMENNLTIDPAFIRRLRRTNPNDPLFVAQNALNDPNIDDSLQDLERPALMERFGLILENDDGFADPANRFVMRGVPHTLALSTSIFFSTDEPPFDRTGWSGDGSPGDGTLRAFATGAVRQHFTKTLDRVAGVDFILPTSGQLNALEAFQLSLGRDADPDLTALELRNAQASSGQALFADPTTGKCGNCHFNGGANAGFTNPPGALNFNFNTGVEVLVHPGQDLDPFPPDGGFGTAPDGSFPAEPVPNPDGSFGNGEFNTPPVVEAADTPPFFHNNVVATIEGAVDFYNGLEFNNSPGGQVVGGINLSAEEVRQVAAFLRVINALENIRNSLALDRRAIRMFFDAPRVDVENLSSTEVTTLLRTSSKAGNLENVATLLRTSAAEIADAIGVLQGGNVHQDARRRLQAAKASIERARKTQSVLRKILLIIRAAGNQIAAQRFMCAARAAVLCGG